MSHPRDPQHLSENQDAWCQMRYPHPLHLVWPYLVIQRVMNPIGYVAALPLFGRSVYVTCTYLLFHSSILQRSAVMFSVDLWMKQGRDVMSFYTHICPYHWSVLQISINGCNTSRGTLHDQIRVRLLRIRCEPSLSGWPNRVRLGARGRIWWKGLHFSTK